MFPVFFAGRSGTARELFLSALGGCNGKPRTPLFVTSQSCSEIFGTFGDVLGDYFLVSVGAGPKTKTIHFVTSTFCSVLFAGRCLGAVQGLHFE